MPVDRYHVLFKCKKCGMEQKVYNGDPDDMTFFEPDMIECYNCGSVEPLFGEDEPFFDPENVVVGKQL